MVCIVSSGEGFFSYLAQLFFYFMYFYSFIYYILCIWFYFFSLNLCTYVRYLVTPLMGADLNNIVKTQKLTDDHVQFLIYQVLRGLKYIHSAGIIHRVIQFFVWNFFFYNFYCFAVSFTIASDATLCKWWPVIERSLWIFSQNNLHCDRFL